MGALNNTSLGLGITFPTLAIMSVCARFYVRRQKKMKLWWDDYLLLPGLVFAIASAICLILASALADIGKHARLDAQGKPLSASLLPTYDKIRYADTALLAPALCFPKLSIIMLYRRIFVEKWFYRATWAMLFINISWGIAFTLVYLFQCQPVSAGWKTSFGIEKQTCINLIAYSYIFAASTILLDVLLIVMPWPMIWKLKMPLRQKIAVTGIFLLGGVVTGISIGKLHAFITVGATIQRNHDITYDEGPLFYWTVPESSLAIVSACLPTLRPIFHGWSADSLIGSIRSRLSLSSLRSGKRSPKQAILNQNPAFYKLPSHSSSTTIKKVTQDAENHEHQEEFGAEIQMIYMNELDPTREAKRWTLEEQKDARISSPAY